MFTHVDSVAQFFVTTTTYVGCNTEVSRSSGYLVSFHEENDTKSTEILKCIVKGYNTDLGF